MGSRDNSPTSGTVFLNENVESYGYNSLLENSHQSPHLLKCPSNGYGKRTCKLMPRWVEKLLKILERHQKLLLLLMQ